MSESKKTYLVHINHPTRDSRLNQDVQDDDINRWKEMQRLAGDVEVQTSKGVITLHADWVDVINDLEEGEQVHKSFNRKLAKVREEDMGKSMGEVFGDELLHFLDRDDPVLRCSIKGGDTFIQLGILHQYLYQIFTALNLASPGSCKFYFSRIDIGHHGEFPQYYPNTYFIASWPFESALDLQKEFNWPELQYFNFEKVWTWLIRVFPLSHSVAESKLQKAIFALLNACTEDPVTHLPTESQIVWLSHALEALFDAPTEQIVKILSDRIFLTLNLPNNNSKKARKLLRDFYAIRSRFVHGDSEIFLPTIYSTYERKLDARNTELIQLVGFVSLIICSTIQMMIDRDWTEISFSEIFHGKH